jgi:IclR family pca regulon transcriptional regulator
MACLQASQPKQLTRHTVTDLEALRLKIAQTRKQGWCLVNQELEEGLVSMAAPIHDRLGRTVAALNISGQVNRTSAKAMQDSMLAPLLAAAQSISRLLTAQSKV